MNSLRIISFLLFSFSATLSFSSSLDSVKVVVIDEKESPMADVKVSIEGSPFYNTNKAGVFKYKPAKKIVMPMNLSVKKDGFEIEEYNYYDSDKELEIRLKKVISKDKSITVHLTSSKKSLVEVYFVYSGKNYTTDKLGNAKISDKKFNQDLFSAKGFKVDKVEFSQKENIYNLQMSPFIPEVTAKENTPVNANSNTPANTPVVKNENDPVKVETTPEAVKAQPEKEMEEVVFKQYQEEFTEISKGILEERNRLLEGNNKIRQQIEELTYKLKNEKNISPAQKEKLKQQVIKLENELIQNTIEYNKAEEKTRGLITNLKFLLMQKDSVLYITGKKLKEEQKRRVAAEFKNKRTLIVFTIISISLLLLAVVFYSIARKMRSQRTALLKTNDELQKLKEEWARTHKV